MAESLGDFEKRTSNGDVFTIRFFNDNTLVEWSEGSSPEEGWAGTWTSGAVKFEYVRTVIGEETAHYEPTGFGVISARSAVIHMGSKDLARLQSY